LSYFDLPDQTQHIKEISAIMPHLLLQPAALPAALVVAAPPCLLHQPLPILVPIITTHRSANEFGLPDASPAIAASSFASSSGGGGASLPAATALAGYDPNNKKQHIIDISAIMPHLLL
jgi:hypothetical protein